ncbi:hypothetical protein CsSME_00007507 [Camellia sinensis var. sinensis]
MHFFTLKLENRPPGAQIVQQPRDGPETTSYSSIGTNLENRPPGTKSCNTHETARGPPQTHWEAPINETTREPPKTPREGPM